MKKLILFITVCFISIGLYASAEKPAIARIASYVEGIVEMKVNPGQKVKKGDLLFTIDVEFTKTIKIKCENDVWYYKEAYERIKKLNMRHSQSLENLQEAEYNLKFSEGSLNIQELLINKWSKYYAPFDGIVTKIYNYSGSAVPNGTCSNNAVLEVTKLEDYNQMKAAGAIKDEPAVAKIASMIGGPVDMQIALGDKVKAGQILFKISTDYNNITKEQQQAKVNYTKPAYDRAKLLYKTKSESLKDYQTAQYNYINAVQNLKSTKLMIDKYSTYCAPFDGIVTDIIYYSGSNVFAGHKVLEVTKD